MRKLLIIHAYTVALLTFSCKNGNNPDSIITPDPKNTEDINAVDNTRNDEYMGDDTLDFNKQQNLTTEDANDN